MNDKYFFTPGRLMVGLDEGYFIINSIHSYSSKMSSEENLYAWKESVDSAVRYPHTLMYLYTLLFMIFSGFGLSLAGYAVMASVVYLFAMYYKYFLVPICDLVPLFITTILRFTICRNPVFKYTVLILVTVLTSSYYILLIFVGVSIVMGTINFIIRQIIDCKYYKKYEIHVYDVELIAFKRFVMYTRYNSAFDESLYVHDLKTLMKDYSIYIHDNY